MEVPFLWRRCAVMAISADALTGVCIVRNHPTRWYHPFYFDRCYDQLLSLA